MDEDELRAYLASLMEPAQVKEFDAEEFLGTDLDIQVYYPFDPLFFLNLLMVTNHKELTE